MYKFAVAPMLDWTDNHCRFFYRLLSKRALLYTEMIVADAIIHGDSHKFLSYSASQNPVALQLGGSDPIKLARAAKIARNYGYDEINLNVGCPSDRVQSGSFGACLMLQPDLVADCVAAIKSQSSANVTVKCRIAVDHQDAEEALDKLVQQSLKAGADGFWVHARKAWLKGLSPKENRDIPPLDYDRVYRLKQKYPKLFIGINGGIADIEAAKLHLTKLDAVMLGRAIYYNPRLLASVDSEIYLDDKIAVNLLDLLEEICSYSSGYLAKGGRLSHILRHMMGLFFGLKDAKLWRRTLTDSNVTLEDFRQIFLQMMERNNIYEF